MTLTKLLLDCAGNSCWRVRIVGERRQVVADRWPSYWATRCERRPPQREAASCADSAPPFARARRAGRRTAPDRSRPRRGRSSSPPSAASPGRRCRCSRSRRRACCPGSPTRCSNGYRFTTSRSIGAMPCSAITASSMPARPSRPPWISGCRVLTRPSMISGKPVTSDTSRTGRPASRSARGGAAGGQQFDAARGERAGQFDQAGLVGNGQQRAADLHRGPAGGRKSCGDGCSRGSCGL